MSDDWKLEVDKLKREIRSLSRPPSFACHRDASIKKDSVITYENCKVHTDGMNAQTGIFTVVVIIFLLVYIKF